MASATETGQALDWAAAADLAVSMLQRMQL
jgi:hypothetical protein